jgi:hypothetical protein
MAVTDILVTPAKIYRAPVGEAVPDESTVAYGAAWGGNWTDLGYTLEPVSLSYETETFKLMVEQLTAPVRAVRQEETITIETVLAEITGANLAMAMDGTNTATSAGVNQVAYDLVEAGGSVSISEYAWGFEGYRLTSTDSKLPVRVFVYRGVATLNGQLTFAKSAGVGIPLRIEAMPDTTKAAGKQILQIHNVTAAPTTTT